MYASSQSKTVTTSLSTLTQTEIMDLTTKSKLRRRTQFPIFFRARATEVSDFHTFFITVSFVILQIHGGSFTM